MPALLERPKMTKMMYQALKKHIMNERERKKQAEQEQDAILERQRKERELRKKKEEEDSLTLEQTKEQIVQLEKRLEKLKAEKHELFSQLKKVLHQEDESRKRAQLKEQSELLSLQQTYTHPIPPVSGHPVLLPPGSMSGRPSLYRPAQTIVAPAAQNVPVKRPRSPSPPPPASGYQYENKINPAVKQQASTLYPHGHHAQGDFKSGSFHPSGQPSQVTYGSQPGPSFQQASVAYSVSKSPGGKFNMASQSAFSSYPSHYAHQQQKQVPEPYPSFPIQRLQQPGNHGYLSANIPLQQQLEQANQKAGFNDKMQQPPQIRGVAPISAQTSSLIPHQLQQSTASKGSIVKGYSGRSQAPPGPQTSSYQPSSSAQASYPGAQPPTQGRPGYSTQPTRGFYPLN